MVGLNPDVTGNVTAMAACVECASGAGRGAQSPTLKDKDYGGPVSVYGSPPSDCSCTACACSGGGIPGGGIPGGGIPGGGIPGGGIPGGGIPGGGIPGGGIPGDDDPGYWCDDTGKCYLST